jgi:type II secretory pathway component PulK
MRAKKKNTGMVFLMTIFAIALLSAVVMGILQINTEEIQLMRNQVYAAQALAIAEAGLNDAFAQIRNQRNWDSGFNDKSFDGGRYTVEVTGTLPSRTIVSRGTTSQGFIAKLEANVTVDSDYPYVVRIDGLRINE